MPHGLAQTLTGGPGEVRIIALGALVGTIMHWSLTRRGDDGPTEGLYDLHADFSYVNGALWEDPDYEKTVILKVPAWKKQYRLEQPEPRKVELVGRQLVMEGVRLCPM